ncbi:MAG: glycosyltransferase family 4 protein [Chromatiales bacterium]|nr:glycosyltransferase family 4 protein [Chromatiales bacterium]
MKVLIANKFFYRNGGSEAVMFQERDFLRSTGVEVVDFAMQDERNLDSHYTSYFVANRSYHSTSNGSLSRLRSAVRLIHSSEAVKQIRRLIKETGVDLMHCHNIYHQLTPSIIRAAKQMGVPVVLTLHDYKPACPVYTQLRQGRVCTACADGDFFNVVRGRCAEGSLAKSYLLYIEAVMQRLLGSYEAVDRVIAPSQFMQTAVINRFAPDRVRVIYNGLDTEQVKPSESDGNYILYLGRLSPEKGIQTLLEAHAEMSNGTRLRVAGTGPLEKILRAEYPNVEFLGHITGDALRRVIESASCIAIPSEWNENCPMSVIEAMGYGKPVVASRIGGIPELVEHGKSGCLFTPGDRQALRINLQQLMDDDSLRRKLGAAARLRVEQHFSLDRHNNELMDLYRQLVTRAREADRFSSSEDYSTL